MDMSFDFGRATESPTSMDAALASIAAGRPFSEGPALYGHVHLQGEGAPLSFYDDLEMLVLNLCIHVPRSLAAEGRADLGMASWNKRYALLRDGGEIVVVERAEEVGDIELGRYPAQTLLDALRAGGLRFADFLDRLVQVDPQWVALLQMLRRELG